MEKGNSTTVENCTDCLALSAFLGSQFSTKYYFLFFIATFLTDQLVNMGLAFRRGLIPRLLFH